VAGADLASRENIREAASEEGKRRRGQKNRSGKTETKTKKPGAQLCDRGVARWRRKATKVTEKERKGLRFERIVRLAVAEQIACAVHGVVQKRRGGENDETGGRGLEEAGDDDREAGGFADVGQEAEGLGIQTINGSCQRMGEWQKVTSEPTESEW